MNRPTHFEMHSAKPEVTTAFFEKVFGWKVSPWQGPHEYWICDTGSAEPGIHGGIMRSRDGNQRTVNTMHVENVDAMCETVVKAGGQVCVPKMAIEGVGWLAYCLDPAGVLFGIMHPDATAR